MGTTKKILFSLLALTLVVSCSTRKNKWLNRNFHAMGTYYNILYNGNLALEQGKERLVQDYLDNYWEILPVERMPEKKEESNTTSSSTSSASVKSSTEKQFGNDFSTPGGRSEGRGMPGRNALGGDNFGNNSMGNGAGGNNFSGNPNSGSGDNFALAEEKATKAIQKHSMLIHGTEYNPQMDEAFLLLGKARYFDHRFVPALSAFNHILDNVPGKTTVIPAKIWKAKTQLRMEFPELALKNLNEILNDHSLNPSAPLKDRIEQLDQNEEIEDEHITAIAATMAQAYIDLNEKEKAIVPISIAANKTKNDDERGRYLYIKGQLYDEMSMTDSANVAFDEIIALNRKTPRIYRIHAFMEKAKNYDLESNDSQILLETLNELAENRENRPYLDNIYHQLAEFHLATDSLEAAIVYYNKSLRENGPDKYLNSRNYLTLGNINFDRAQYKDAGAYYDSTLVNLDKSTREYRKLKKKRDNLDDVIYYEDIAGINDSILNLVAMTESERLAYFKEYTDDIKAKQIEQEIAAFKASKSVKQFSGGQSSAMGFNSEGAQSEGKFYFYEPTQVAYGKLSFTQIWGDRPLQDDWRTKDSGGSKSKTAEKEEKLTKDAIIANIEANPKFDPQSYIDKIPTDIAVIDSLKKERDFAYYQLGVIYKEKFHEYELASDKLEALLKNQPEERLILPSKYNLYKIYQETGQTQKESLWKKDILDNHPDSRYAQIILNPQEYRAGEDTPEAVYANVYRKYLNEEYETVIEESDEYITKYTGDPIVPKFELLKAVAIGRYKGYQHYKEALNFVALNYPLSDEGKKAQELYDNAIPAMSFQQFDENTPEESYNLIYTFSRDSLESAQVLRDTLAHAVANFDYGDLTVSIDFYNKEKIFVAVHGLSSHLGGKGFGMILRDEEDYQIQRDFFVISSSNYKNIFIHKNLDDYLVWNGNKPKPENIPETNMDSQKQNPEKEITPEQQQEIEEKGDIDNIREQREREMREREIRKKEIRERQEREMEEREMKEHERNQNRDR